MPPVENFKYVNWIKRINQLMQIILCISFILGLNVFATKHYWRSDLTKIIFILFLLNRLHISVKSKKR